MRKAGVALVGGALLSSLMAFTAPAVARAATCAAQTPGAYPNDPDYSPAENAAGITGPTWDSEDWYLYGCIPKDLGPPPNGTGTASDPIGAAGMNVDTLWNRAINPQRGNDTVVAYMEGGVNWRIGSSCELKDRAWLNTANLPFPQFAGGTDATTYDLNGDGVVNVEDYVNDPRVLAAVAGVPKSPAGGLFIHHVCAGAGVANTNGYAPTDITPEDLIVAFGHCQVDQASHHIVGAFPCNASQHFNNDGSGYPNNINGWNFNRDNNDPQTEQSVYGHFNGESGQAIAEGNNGFSGIGLCPLCRYVPIKAGDEAIDRPDRVAEAIVFAANIGVNVMDVTSASLGLNPTVQAAVNYAYAKGMTIAWASNDFESADHTDGMYYANVWPGNSVTGDHSTRNGATCPIPPPIPPSSGSAFCGFVLTDTTFLSRSSLTSYGPHALFSTPNPDGSTSTGTPTNAGVAALMVAEGKAATQRAQISSPLSANEVRQVVRASALPISSPCPAAEPCFTGPAGTSFNIQYGYGRPNVLAGANLIDANHIPPSANIDSPSWYQEIDPTKQASVQVSADVAASRVLAGGACACQYTWQLQYGLGPQPTDSPNQWVTFANGSGNAAQTVSGSIDLTQSALQSFASTTYAVDPTTRLSIEQYDISVRVQVFANGDTSHGYAMGEDRRAFHLRYDPTELPGFPVAINSSGDASPTLADIEARGWLDTILPTADGSVHAIRPDGSEAPGFPVHTGPAVGMDPTYGHNYLSDPTWGGSVVPRPRDPIFTSAAVGDLTHTGSLDIVAGTSTGFTYAWDGAGRLLPGFPVLNGTPALFGLSVPPPNTPYSFQPENITGGSPVLADLEPARGQLDIIQPAGDDQLHAWRPDGTPVPGWPVSTNVALSGGPGSGTQRTHDSKVVPTPAVVMISGSPVVVVGLDDTILGASNSTSNPPVTAFLLEYNANGTLRSTIQIPGLIQGYGVAQDFVTQGVESPAAYDDPANGPQAVVNANLFLPVRVNLTTGAVSSPFPATVIPSATGTPPTSGASGASCPVANSVPPTFTSTCALAQFTTSPTLGKVVSSSLTPLVFQTGSSATDILLGITQTPGFGIRVDNGLGGWDPVSGASLTQYSHYVQGLSFFAAPAIADVNGDGFPDIIVPGDSGALTAFDGVSGLAATGFPKWTGGWSLWAPAVGDMSGSGHTDVVEATREGFVHAFQTGGNGCAGNNEAWHWHQNDWNNGHYGSDTRPPSAITDLSVTQQGANDALGFTAVGDDWKCGTATSYQVFRSSTPITQDNVAQATLVPVTQAPGAAGTLESLTVPHVDGQTFYAVRAVDKAGNIGPLRLGIGPGNATPEFALGPVSAIVLSGIVAAIWRLRRRGARKAG
jgi:hypothetical protein